MKTRRYVANGRVWCPIRGDTDLEACLSCGQARSIDEGPRPSVDCVLRRTWDVDAVVRQFAAARR